MASKPKVIQAKVLLERPCGNANEALQKLRTGGKKSNLSDEGD